MKRWPAQAGERSHKRSGRLAAPAMLLLLSACGNGETEPVREASVGEARALDQAAEMLDEQRHEKDDEEAAVTSASPGPSSNS